MPDWPKDEPPTPPNPAKRLGNVLIVLVMSLTMGMAGTLLSIYFCLRSVEGRQIDLQAPDIRFDGPEGVGPVPEVDRLHVREGVFWAVASDRVRGAWWVHLERLGEPSINPSLSIPTVPRWAEPPAWMFANPGADQPVDQRLLAPVGTLAVGWPWLAAAQRWIELDRTTGFIPHIENDDDGSTTAKAAARFGTRGPDGGPYVLWPGFLANTVLFAAIAAPFIVLIRRRVGRVA